MADAKAHGRAEDTTIGGCRDFSVRYTPFDVTPDGTASEIYNQLISNGMPHHLGL